MCENDWILLSAWAPAYRYFPCLISLGPLLYYSNSIIHIEVSTLTSMLGTAFIKHVTPMFYPIAQQVTVL